MDFKNCMPFKYFASSSSLLFFVGVGEVGIEMCEDYVTSFQLETKLCLEGFLDFDLISVSILFCFNSYITFQTNLVINVPTLIMIFIQWFMICAKWQFLSIRNDFIKGTQAQTYIRISFYYVLFQQTNITKFSLQF